MKIYADQIRPFVHAPYKVVGTDGFGRSDNRSMLRHFFEVDRHYITLKALSALADSGEIERSTVAEALKKYRIDPRKPNPVTV
jgi:pyruvate dehydrogenase E1 component